MPEWSLEALRLLETYLDLVARAARELGLDVNRSVARVRGSLTASAESGFPDRVHQTCLLRVLGELGPPARAAEMAGAPELWRGPNRSARPA